MSKYTLEAPLEVQEAVEVLETEDAIAIAPKPKNAEVVASSKAGQFLSQLTATKPGSPEFSKAVENVYALGRKEIQATSNVSNRLLERPAQQGAAGSPQMKVANNLGELRQQVTELDPNRADLKGVKKILKFLPGGNKIDAYFNRYASAQSQLDAITRALSSGQDELRRDNADIEVFRTALWDDMGKLSEYNILLGELDIAIENAADDAEATGDTELAKAMRTEALYAVRQRRTDIQTQIAVATQGYLALDIVRKNNLELVRGVDRAQSTTMAAIKTAIVVAQALGVQEKVLAQINGLNATTGNILESTSERLKTQGAEIQRQAGSSTIEVEKLENAFKNVFEAMDSVDNFRLEANENFSRTIGSLETQVKRAKQYVERAQS